MCMLCDNRLFNKNWRGVWFGGQLAVLHSVLSVIDHSENGSNSCAPGGAEAVAQRHIVSHRIASNLYKRAFGPTEPSY